MDLRITIDISERLAGALSALASTIQSVIIQTAPAQTAPEPVAETEPVVIPPAPESAPTEAVQPQETAITEIPANDGAPSVEPAPEKPKKKKAAKKATEAPEPAPEPEAPIAQPAIETPQTVPTEAQETAPKPEGGDPMGGLTVIEAMQALTNEIQEKGIDLAQVNSRVRIKANELGLSYGSAACLIKAIGYVEARKIALGEK